MAILVNNRTQETCAAPGTGTVTLLGAVTGYRTFSAGIGANNLTYYTIADQTGSNWEVGIGTVGSGGTTLIRTTVLDSSNGGSLTNFSSGTQNVWVDYPAEKAVIVNDLGDVLVNQSYDQGTGVLQVTGQSTFNGAVTDNSLNLQGGNNLVLNSATLVTQNITVTANIYTLSMTGTGTITLSGTSSGTLVGTGASTVVSKTFTPTAGTLTLTPTGSCTTVQLELGSVFSGYTATTGTAVTTTNNISVPSGQVLAGAGTPALPSVAVGSNNTGIYGSSTTLGFSAGGSVYAYLNSSGLGVYGALTLGSSGDGIILRDAANTLAQRNSTNAQTFRLYNTYTSSTSYENLQIDWTTTANTATISTQAGSGGGTVRNLAIGQDLYVNSVRVGLGGGSVTSNTAVGSGVMTATATGVANSGFGTGALSVLTSGNNNSASGFYSLHFNTTGGGNEAFGYSSLQNNISGNNNNAFGLQTLLNNTTASNLTAIGHNALYNNTTNVATLGTITGGTGYTNGTYTGVVMTLSSGSTALTYPTATIVVAGGAVTTVTLTSNGVAFRDTTTVLTAPAASIGGTGSGFSVPVATLASGTENVAVGYQSLYSSSTGNYNTAVGSQALYSNTTGGQNAGSSYGNSAFGRKALYSNTTGGSNNAYGMTALFSNTTGNTNNAFGQNALGANTTGGGNSAFGDLALYSNTTGSNNSAFGSNSLQLCTGNSNVAVGLQALQNTTTGSNNIAIGVQSGQGNGSANKNTIGTNNTYIGYQTVGSANNNTNEMVIGYTAVGLGSNTTVIGNTSTTLTQTYGVTKSTNYTVATLPSASTSGVGARAFVTDALAPVFGSAVAGSGAVPVPVYVGASNTWYVG